MFQHVNVVAASVFIFFFALVTVLGFVAARWKAADLDHIVEWGLGGRRFGPWITWFLLGGDLYTAYTVIAVPAVVYAIGAFGFFAVPYTIIIYPFLYLTLPRLWAVSHKHGYMTAGDFVLGRYGDRWLELAVALTGILATMPYIALQLIGLEKVIGALGFSGEGSCSMRRSPSPSSSWRSTPTRAACALPAMIAFVKDAMIYVFIIAAIVLIPHELGGFGRIFEVAQAAYAAKVAAKAVPAAGLTLAPWPDRAVRHARDRLGDGALHVSARADRRPGRIQRARDPAQHDDASRLFRRPGADCALGGDGARRRRDREDSAGRRPPARPLGLSGLVCRVSASPRSRSERWFPPQSCRSGRRTPSPGTCGSRSSIRE